MPGRKQQSDVGATKPLGHGPAVRRDNRRKSVAGSDLEPGIPPIGVVGWLFAAALVIAVFLAYQPAWNAGFIWDDDLHLLNNPVLQPGGWLTTWDPRSYVNYWPVTWSAYRLQYELWGLNPSGFHLVNLAMHACAALLAWRVLASLRVPGAMLAAALFALHPVNVESGAWITQLKNTLSLSLTLLSVLWYLRYEQRGSRWRYALSLGIFILATLAKGMTLTLPFVLLACAWWQRNRITRRDVLRVLPYLLIGMLMAALEVWLQHRSAQATGAVVRTDSLPSRAAVAGCAVWFYFGKLIWPTNLLFVYPRWHISEWNLLAYLPGVLLVVMLVLAWRRRHTWGRPVVMLLICYVGLLGPALGFVNIYFMRYSLVADHWQYAAMIVPCAMFAGGVAVLCRRWPWTQPTALLLGLVLLAVLAALTFQQCRVYANLETLYKDVIAGNPDCWLAHGNLGEHYSNIGRTADAIACYKEALRIYPDCIESRNNLGFAYAHLGRFEEAITEYRCALKVKPDHAQIHKNLADALLALRRFDEAIAEYRTALEIDRNWVDARNALGNALASQRRFDEAIAEYRRLLETNPGATAVRFNLATALMAGQRFNEAIREYNAVLQNEPRFPEAHNRLGKLLFDQDRLDEAIDHFQAAVQLNPELPGARQNLAVVVAQRDRLLAALNEARQALDAEPENVVRLNNVAWMLATSPSASLRNGAAAVDLAQRAVQLSGGQQPKALGTLAAAYAEAGLFSKARQTARDALKLAEQQKNAKLADTLKARLRLYDAGLPFRQRP
jgi:protein O-mannosyl-transferase